MVDLSKSGTGHYVTRRGNWWAWSAAVIAILVVLPILAVFFLAFFPKENIWPHLMSSVLPRYLWNTVVMMVSVATLSSVLGVTTAWLVVMKQFPGRRVLEWALLLPLAIPAYIGAYAFVDFWEYAGPAQGLLRDVFGWTSAKDYWFPEVRSRSTAILVISFSLYPYVYLFTRAAYREQSANALEVSRALGCSGWQSFLRVGLPLARPAIAASATVVMMETLNDFGTVEFFAVQTLTTGIFSVWLEASNVGGAAQIACVMFTLVLALILFERYSRRNSRVAQMPRSNRKPQIEPLGRFGQVGAVLFCVLPVVAGFVMPFTIMLSHALGDWSLWADPVMKSAALTSLWVAGLAAFLTVGASVLLVYSVQLTSSLWPARLVPVTTIGYAAPGAVLGLGIIILLGNLDHKLADLIEATTGAQIGLILSGTGFAVVFAYFVRFFALAFGSLDAGFGRIPHNLGNAGRSLGLVPSRVLRKIHIPLLKTTILSAILLVFVDCVKELPATLLLRPFGFDTLATHVYTFASTEDIEAASTGAMAIILISILAVILLAKSSQRST